MSNPPRQLETIVGLQSPDGSWGRFHSLAEPTPQQPMTTEQALRRLRILGVDRSAEPIQRAVRYMERCLAGLDTIPDRREKVCDWDCFTNLILATWIRAFEPDNQVARPVGLLWAQVIERAFRGGQYDHREYIKAYQSAFGRPPRGGRLEDFVCFYQLSLMQGLLRPEVQRSMIDHILQHQPGVYYVYDGVLRTPPAVFASRQSSRYIAALELLAGYETAGEKLGFAVHWLQSHKNGDGSWDMGVAAQDGVHLPLSDSWRNPAVRMQDCTARIRGLLARLTETTGG